MASTFLTSFYGKLANVMLVTLHGMKVQGDLSSIGAEVKTHTGRSSHPPHFTILEVISDKTHSVVASLGILENCVLVPEMGRLPQAPHFYFDVSLH